MKGLLNLYINDFSDDEYVLDPIRSPIPNPTHGFPVQTLRQVICQVIWSCHSDGPPQAPLRWDHPFDLAPLQLGDGLVGPNLVGHGHEPHLTNK